MGTFYLLSENLLNEFYLSGDFPLVQLYAVIGAVQLLTIRWSSIVFQDNPGHDKVDRTKLLNRLSAFSLSSSSTLCQGFTNISLLSSST